jgi:hypothetical protein
MKKLWEEFQYFFQQKIYVIILCLTAICGYGFEMTHPSIGIDDTAVSLYLEDGLEVVMGRWFIYLINKIFHLSDFSPFMMELIGVILLCISATLFCIQVFVIVYIKSLIQRSRLIIYDDSRQNKICRSKPRQGSSF